MSLKAKARRLKKAMKREAYLEQIEENKKNLKAYQKANRRKKRLASKPFNHRRVLTRKIMRNMLKSKLNKHGFQHVNKNFNQILSNITIEEKLELLEIK